MDRVHTRSTYGRGKMGGGGKETFLLWECMQQGVDHVCMYVCACMCMCVSVYMCVSAYVSVHVSANVCMSMCFGVCVYARVYVSICVCMCVCVCVCMCVYVHVRAFRMCGADVQFLEPEFTSKHGNNTYLCVFDRRKSTKPCRSPLEFF
jgi:hypothetical protein